MTWRFSRLCDIVVDVITQVWCVFQDLEFGWRVIVGSDIGYFTVVFGSFGDDRGNGIFVPMLILIIGFDPKTSTEISICKNLYSTWFLVLMLLVSLHCVCYRCCCILFSLSGIITGISREAVLLSNTWPSRHWFWSSTSFNTNAVTRDQYWCCC